MIVEKKRVLVPFWTTVILAFLLTGCGCEHEWQRSSCQTPRTCIHCGKTEGKVRGHEWGSTACNAPEGCIVCGTLEGIELTHEWREDCKICIYCGWDERPADEQFPEALAAGLEERWKLESDLQENSQTDEEYVLTKEDWKALFDTEYTRMEPFKEAVFQNEALGKAAQRYIKSLESSINALEFYGTDQWEDQYHNGAYWEQAAVLFEINTLSPLSIGENYQNTFTQMVTNGEIINMVGPLLDQIKFLHINTTGTTKKFETTVKNTTSLTFQWFSLDVNLLNKDQTIVESENIKVTNWKPGQKKQFNFTTDKEFAAIDVAFANWELPRK